MRIRPETVDRIKQAADIVEVVGDYVSLKKRGANYTACCPFHNEKTPSFNVNPARQIYKCFGCGAAGDAVKFVMDIDNVGYGEALRQLAQKYQIELEMESVSDEEAALQVALQNERESLYIVLNFAKNFYVEQLDASEEGQAIGLSYFQERGFSAATRKKFELGYSPDRWDALLKQASSQGYNPDLLEKAGLLIRKEGGTSSGYDRFRGRVIFPIHNVVGKVIGFGARILKTDKNQPKYLNSPETAIYHKSEVLYGMYQAKNAIRQQDVCYLVEGYTDVVSLHQAGIEPVVASSGTSLTVEQIKLIGRFTSNVTILYDGDPAGIKAALRGLDLLLEEGLNVNVVLFPEKHDPDSYVKAVGALAFQDYIKRQAQDFISFKTHTLLQDAGQDPFRRAEVIGEVVQSIIKIPDAIKRQVFFQRTATLMQVDEQMLISEGNKLLLKQQQQKKKEQERAATPSTLEQLGLSDLSAETPGLAVSEEVLSPPTPPQRERIFYHEEECIRLLINHAAHELEPGVSLCHYVLSELAGIEFRHPLYQHILSLFRMAFMRGEVLPTDYFLSHPETEIQQEAIHFVTVRHELSDEWQKHEIYVPTELDKLHDAAYTNILRLKKGYNELIMKAIKEDLAKATTEEETDSLLLRFMHHKALEKQIADLLGTVISG